MTTGSISVRYARALLALAEERRNLPAMQREWKDLGDTVAGSPALGPALSNPKVPVARREALLGELLDRLPASPATRSAARLLLRKGRVMLLPEVARAFERMVEERTGRGKAVVTTAAPMNEDFHRRLQERLERLSGRKLTVERRVDPDVLGGVVARVGDMLYDGSLRAALDRLHEQLTAGTEAAPGL
ncbi:MAG: ATP synthase F1 subunit delta [Deltaproteobacteria bacterium]|nr:ATP synthase F1 subunit delta [Deltaproteobacteria bacterium]